MFKTVKKKIVYSYVLRWVYLTFMRFYLYGLSYTILVYKRILNLKKISFTYISMLHLKNVWIVMSCQHFQFIIFCPANKNKSFFSLFIYNAMFCCCIIQLMFCWLFLFVWKSFGFLLITKTVVNFNKCHQFLTSLSFNISVSFSIFLRSVFFFVFYWSSIFN